LQYALIAVSSAKTRLSPSFIMKLPSSISKQAWAVASVSVENERLLYFKGVRLTKPVNEVVPHPEHLIPALSPNRPARVRRRWLSREFPLEKVCLLLAVETDLEPDAASGVRDRQERDWLDVAVIQPSTDSIHSLAEGTSRLSRPCFDLHDEWGIERHIALLSIAREAGAALSWCRVSDRAHQ
jgi:hypothetical protein